MAAVHTGSKVASLPTAPENETDTALLYRALADETRRSIIRLLLQHNLCVSALAGRLNISESAVSQHLKILRQARLLHGEKRGYFMHYDIDRERLRTLGKEILDMADLTRSDDAPGQARKTCAGTTAGFPDVSGKILLPLAPVSETRS